MAIVRFVGKIAQKTAKKVLDTTKQVGTGMFGMNKKEEQKEKKSEEEVILEELYKERDALK